MSIFTKIAQKKPKRSNFDLSHEVKLSTEFGRLTPILCQEVLPRDKWICKTEIFCRMAPMLAPIMHRVNVYTHFFFVPNRIIWNNWENFITGTPLNGRITGTPADKDLTFAVSPSLSGRWLSYDNVPTDVLGPGTLSDYLGVPIYDEEVFGGNGNHGPGSITFNALPFRAYQKIFNEYYRDENLVDEVPIYEDQDGDVLFNFSPELLKIRHRAFEKDYFTSALPWPQKGPEANIPVDGNYNLTVDPTLTSEPSLVYEENGNLLEPDAVKSLQVDTHGNLIVGSKRVKVVTNGQSVELRGVSNTTINDLRHAMRLQEFLEKDARGGTRLAEILRSHFGVRPDDLRLQRPQYLGGGRTNIIISEVLQQSESTPTSNLGEMGGHGVTAGVSHKFKHTFKEHGWIIGIMSIMPRTSYQQGLHRQFTRVSRFDYAWPEFAHLGEQNVLKKELFYDYNGATSKNDDDFGYAPRYAEYKFINSSVHGDMATNLDFWHLGRKFSSQPSLNEKFITCKPYDDKEGQDNGLNRIFAVTDSKIDHFWIQVYHKIIAKRPLPYYGTPLL